MRGEGGGAGAREGGTAFDREWAVARPQVAAFARRVLVNHADAEDLCQIVAVRAWRGYATFRGESAFLTWVMAIARREAARLAVRRQRLAARESLLPEPPEPPESLEPAAPGADEDGRAAPPLAELAARARMRGELNATEEAVLCARLEHPDRTWEQLGETLGLPATRCAVAHCRAVVKLRVSLFLHHPELLGGKERLTRAMERSRASPDPLTPAEEAVFRLMVLDRAVGTRPRNWPSLLRGSCAKVARELSRNQ